MHVGCKEWKDSRGHAFSIHLCLAVENTSVDVSLSPRITNSYVLFIILDSYQPGAKFSTVLKIPLRLAATAEKTRSVSRSTEVGGTVSK